MEYELMWLQILMGELGIHDDGSIRLYYYNKAVIYPAHNPVRHDKTNHVEIDWHYKKKKDKQGFDLHTL